MSESDAQTGPIAAPVAAKKEPAAKKEKAPEFNPRWKGYVYIGMTSLVNFASISNAQKGDRRSYLAVSLAFGIFTCSASVLVLAQDRSQTCLDKFHFSKAREGYFEGCTLLFFVLWWIVG
jgi:hypothetical protein